MKNFIKKASLIVFLVFLSSCGHQNKIKEYTDSLKDLPCTIEKVDNRIYSLNDDYSYEYEEKLRLFEHDKLIFEKEIDGNLYTNSKGQSLFEFADNFIYLVNNFENENTYSIFSLDKNGNETCILSKNYDEEESKYYTLACDNTYKYIYLSREVHEVERRIFVDKYGWENNQLIFIESNKNASMYNSYFEEVMYVKKDIYFIDINGHVIKNYHSSLTGITKTAFVEDNKLYGYSIQYNPYSGKYYIDLFDDENMFKSLFDFSSFTYIYYAYGNKNRCLFVFAPESVSKDKCSYIFLYDREEEQVYGNVVNSRISNFAFINNNFYYTQVDQDYMIHI